MSSSQTLGGNGVTHTRTHILVKLIVETCEERRITELWTSTIYAPKSFILSCWSAETVFVGAPDANMEDRKVEA